jgi:hypothetical protein
MFPDAHRPPSADDVCVVLSSFSQLIVVPLATVSGRPLPTYARRRGDLAERWMDSA